MTQKLRALGSVAEGPGSVPVAHRHLELQFQRIWSPPQALWASGTDMVHIHNAGKAFTYIRQKLICNFKSGFLGLNCHVDEEFPQSSIESPLLGLLPKPCQTSHEKATHPFILVSYSDIAIAQLSERLWCFLN